MVEDAARFGYILQHPTGMGIPRNASDGSRPAVRESLSGYAAVAPALGRMTTLVLPRANTAIMNLFPAQVAAHFADSFVVMYVDGAGRHTCPGVSRLPGQDDALIVPTRQTNTVGSQGCEEGIERELCHTSATPTACSRCACSG